MFDTTPREDWAEHWQDMTEYNNINQPGPAVIVEIKFKTVEDYNEFHKKIKKYLYDGEKVFDGMQSKTKKNTWYPLKEKPSNYIYE